MSESSALGDYLRARREQVSPADVGLPVAGVRRVAGLRREEVAMLAGISADYYLRLEQGRDRHPSVQVLESLARVLQLDQVGTDYLITMALPRPRAARRRPKREVVPSGVAQLIELIGLPAFVEGRYFDVLASNALARAISPTLQVGENRMRAIFTDPAEQALYPDWEKITGSLVAGFRDSVGTDLDDPRFVELVGELSLSSERFRQLWARHEVQARGGGILRIDHPQVGLLTVRREKLIIGDAAGQMLVIYHAEPGTDSHERLALLASLASSASPASPASPASSASPASARARAERTSEQT